MLYIYIYIFFFLSYKFQQFIIFFVFLKASCLIVAILLHYFFMAAFSWMFCEGFLLFVTLQFVFYEGLFNRRKFYFVFGWSKYTMLPRIPNYITFYLLALPIPIVVVSAAVSHEQYGINDV